MFYIETRYIILIIIILGNLNIHIFASRLQMKPLTQETITKIYNFKNRFSNAFVKRNVDSEDKDNGRILNLTDYENIPLNKESPNDYVREDNIINKFSFIGDELFNLYDEIPDDNILKIEDTNYPFEIHSNNEDLNDDFYTKFQTKNSYTNIDGDYEYPIALIYRRDVPSNINTRNLENSSLYPSVLTKALEISLNPSDVSNIGGNVLANVAKKLNTSPLDLAEKLTKSENLQYNDQFGKMIQSYLKNKAIPSSTALNQRLSLNKENLTENLPLTSNQQPESSRVYLENQNSMTTSSLTEILERVLEKLENIHDSKNNNHEDHPDGAPCDIIGSWSSTTLGLCFDIQLQKDKTHDISSAEINNKILTINVVECTPAKQHQLIDLDWKFTGSALKQWGGPFYVYGQKRSESVVTTFVGFCRTCDGIDTIFGSWNFLLPSKDCNDISLAFEVKRDILRRVRMEMKRKERFKNLLYQNRVGRT